MRANPWTLALYGRGGGGDSRAQNWPSRMGSGTLARLGGPLGLAPAGRVGIGANGPREGVATATFDIVGLHWLRCGQGQAARTSSRGKPRQTPGRSALRIRTDLDEFVQAGQSVQLTWMDAKVRDCVMTSRICKAMEVEMLWIPGTGGRAQRLRSAPLAAARSRPGRSAN